MNISSIHDYYARQDPQSNNTGLAKKMFLHIEESGSFPPQSILRDENFSGRKFVVKVGI